ncbi:hypothetical protein AOQ84DRAFT_256489, partial [Glonium stellatum]
MTDFEFSIIDITAVGTFAWNLYKSCKPVTHSPQVKCIAANPHSLIYSASNGQRLELKRLMEACKSDLQDLEKLLTKYKSPEPTDPQTEDKTGFSLSEQSEIRVKLFGDTDRLNVFLTQLDTNALGGVEMDNEMHGTAFEKIKTKLDLIHQDVIAGKKGPALLSDMQDWGSLEQELVDDNITETDVELNKDYIVEWLKKTREGKLLEDNCP